MERTDTELQAAGIREADVSVQLTKEVQARSEPRLRHRCTSQRRVSVLNPGNTVTFAYPGGAYSKA
jgi:hypothetical protein